MSESAPAGYTPPIPPLPRRSGDGNVNITIGVVKGRVIFELPPGKDWAAMDPENARTIALALGKAAFEAHYGVKPGGAEGAAGITDDMRMRCINRALTIARGLAQEGKDDKVIAAAVVDNIIRMVL